MRSQLIQRVVGTHSSLAFQNYSDKYFLKVWHYHPELELNVIHESIGTAFVGDSIERFEPGDVVLVGKNLPHLWLNDEIYFKKDSRLIARVDIIHFFGNFAGGLLEIPEMADLNNLLKRAELGIKFTGKSIDPVIEMISKMADCPGYDRIMLFIDILKRLSLQREYKILSSTGYTDSFIRINNDRLLPVYKYIMQNFRTEISLDTVANLANMNPSSFSRYFTNIHSKSFTQFLNEIRIGYACKLLMENRNISCACYESGFNNTSNFNRQFKAIKNMTPSDYIKCIQIFNCRKELPHTQSLA